MVTHDESVTNAGERIVYMREGWIDGVAQ